MPMQGAEHNSFLCWVVPTLLFSWVSTLMQKCIAYLCVYTRECTPQSARISANQPADAVEGIGATMMRNPSRWATSNAGKCIRPRLVHDSWDNSRGSAVMECIGVTRKYSKPSISHILEPLRAPASIPQPTQLFWRSSPRLYISQEFIKTED